jgi:hypothetical protein
MLNKSIKNSPSPITVSKIYTRHQQKHLTNVPFLLGLNQRVIKTEMAMAILNQYETAN